jgi:hypothetical protein
VLFRSSGETYYGQTSIAESIPLAVAGALAGGLLARDRNMVPSPTGFASRHTKRSGGDKSRADAGTC